MKKGNYFLYSPDSYKVTFCNSDCARIVCQRNKESSVYKTLEARDFVDMQEDFSDYCSSYMKPFKVVDYNVT